MSKAIEFKQIKKVYGEKTVIEGGRKYLLCS